MEESIVRRENAMEYLVKSVLVVILIEKNQYLQKKLKYENFRNR